MDALACTAASDKGLTVLGAAAAASAAKRSASELTTTPGPWARASASPFFRPFHLPLAVCTSPLKRAVNGFAAEPASALVPALARFVSVLVGKVGVLTGFMGFPLALERMSEAEGLLSFNQST
jgi:hypothetical protein